MSDVLEELADEEEGKLNRAHLERRLEDWTHRISTLFDAASNWLPAGFTTASDRQVPMFEELMVRYKIPEVRLPVLTIYKDGVWFGELVPRGLWIIGANGRVDLFTKSAHFIIADRAENFEMPKWMIAPSDERLNQKVLDQQSFLQAIGL